MSDTGPHRTTVRVRFSELDPYNHVNHAVYVQYFETARVELLAEAGFSLASLREAGHSIVVSEIRTRFLASAEELDTLVIESEILDFKRVTSTWRQRIRRGDQLIATQDLRAAMLRADGRPTRFPEEMVAALARYVVEP